MSKIPEKWIAGGYCDERAAGFCATATKLPKGEYGMVALCVKGNKLSLYDVDSAIDYVVEFMEGKSDYEMY